MRKLVFVLAVLALGACSSPIAPNDCDDPETCEHLPDGGSYHLPDGGS